MDDYKTLIAVCLGIGSVLAPIIGGKAFTKYKERREVVRNGHYETLLRIEAALNTSLQKQDRIINVELPEFQATILSSIERLLTKRLRHSGGGD